MTRTVCGEAYSVWCEWEIGLETCLFKTEEDAWKAAEENIKLLIEEEGAENDTSFEQIKKDGLVQVKKRLILD